MNNKNLANYYVWAIKALVLIIPFLSVWIATSMFFPYITGRNFAFRILIEIALVLWGALAILKKEYRPRLTPIAIAVSIFVVIIGAADLLGIDPYNSIWSRLERMEGYMMILHLAAYFLILTSVFRTKKDWFVFFNSVLIAGLWVGGYGVLQLLGIKQAIQGGNVRIDGTIGNPTYLAAYLTLVIGLGLILLFNSKDKIFKWIYSAIIVFNFILIYYTATRGAALSLLIAIPLFLVLYLIFFRGDDPKERRFKKIAIGLLVVIIVVPAGFWLMRATSLVQNNAVLSRLTSTSLGERTIKSRFQIWGIAWRAFQERPVLGWGQDNFLYAFSKYFDPRLYDQEPWFDRPHDIFFEWLIDGGILGFLSYFALFGTLFFSIFKLFKRNFLDKKEAIVLIVVPIAYLAQNVFVFDNFNTYVLFFGILAYVNSLYSEHIAPKHPVVEQKNAEQFSLGFLVIGAILMSVIIYFCNFKALAQAQGIITALKATSDQVDPVGKTTAAFKETLAQNSFGTGETLEQMSRVAGLLLGSNNVPNSSKIPFLEYTIGSLEEYLKAHPDNLRLHLMVGGLYQTARSLNPQLVFKAREHLKAALDLSPTKQQILFLLADNFLATGETAKAMELLQQAIDLEPTYRDAFVNHATVAILIDRNDLALKDIESLNKIRLGSSDQKLPDLPLWNYINDLQKIFSIYRQAGQLRNARMIFDRILALKPEIVKFHEENGYYKELISGLQSDLK